ncbi:hypothetical protein KAJ27_01360 [bacterium]|nr:hypothetical protein [bacterium]
MKLVLTTICYFISLMSRPLFSSHGLFMPVSQFWVHILSLFFGLFLTVKVGHEEIINSKEYENLQFLKLLVPIVYIGFGSLLSYQFITDLLSGIRVY